VTTAPISAEQALSRLAADLLAAPTLTPARIVSALSVAYTLGALAAMQSEIGMAQRAELSEGALQ